jgi:proteasome lid subunit RPN8/RPN11
MRRDVVERAPEEACGLVAGIGNRSQRVFIISNIMGSSTRFQLDPQQQLDVLLMIEDNDWELLGIYHSHPTGPAYPSARDILEAAYPEAVHLIWSPLQGDWVCRGFFIEKGKVKEVSLLTLDQQEYP